MHARRLVGTTTAVLAALGLGAAAPALGSSGATAIEGHSYGLSSPVRDLDPATAELSGQAAPARVNPLAGQGDAGVRATRNRRSVPADPLASDGAGGSGARAPTPTPSLVFDGTGNPLACGTCTPPDTNGDVGPNNYVQMVNATKVAIFNKAGTPLVAPFNLSTLFTSGPCSTGNLGDPIVLYDSIADRWLLSQFYGNPIADTGGFCFAISQTPDPTGAYFLSSFTAPHFPDYFKVGVWPNAYYVSTNESDYVAYAFDRAKMLAGDPTASGVRFPGETNFLMPADVDGPRTPGGNEGGLFYTFKDDAFPSHGGGSDRIELFQLTPNFASPPSSTFTKITSFAVAPFTYTVCGFFVLNCIPQSGTAQGLDPVSEWPMFRFVWRNLGDHQALVGNFTVGGGSATPGAAPRWFELRNTGAGWSLYQEGTFDPADGLNRWMGSIAIDVEGNISLGYSASNSSSFPSIRYATRAPSDPPGTLGGEQILKAGGGSQTSLANRWGDYSAMTVDPANDCSFWDTSEYYSATSANAWKTAIGTFTIPTCADTDKDGVADNVDACPTTPDLTTPDGCPSNAFTIDKKKRNKKKGTAKISVTVPGAGTLALKGKNLKKQRPAHPANARSSKPVSGAGTFKLKVIPKGKTKKKLKKKGKAKVTAKITYTPSGGLANTQKTKVKLKKKGKKKHK